MAIANRPELLIADEPTSSLDILVQDTVLDLLKELRATLGMALILISHNLRTISKVAEETLVLYGGHLAEIGQTKKVLETSRHWYTAHLRGAIPGQRVPTTIVAPWPRAEASGGDVTGAGCPYVPHCPRADEICRSDVPPLVEFGGPDSSHRVSCWHPLASENQDAHQ
jgi:oligopeptide/dipeptide ABC transporter ATP-binding protein